MSSVTGSTCFLLEVSMPSVTSQSNISYCQPWLKGDVFLFSPPASFCKIGRTQQAPKTPVKMAFPSQTAKRRSEHQTPASSILCPVFHGCEILNACSLLHVIWGKLQKPLVKIDSKESFAQVRLIGRKGDKGDSQYRASPKGPSFERPPPAPPGDLCCLLPKRRKKQLLAHPKLHVFSCYLWALAELK